MKYQIRLLLKTSILPSLVFIIIVPLLISIRNLNSVGAAFVLEKFVSLIGIMLFIPAKSIDIGNQVLETTQSKEIQASLILLLRIILQICVLLLFTLLFCCVTLLFGSVFPFGFFVLGTIANAGIVVYGVFMGSGADPVLAGGNQIVKFFHQGPSIFMPGPAPCSCA